MLNQPLRISYITTINNVVLTKRNSYNNLTLLCSFNLPENKVINMVIRLFPNTLANNAFSESYCLLVDNFLRADGLEVILKMSFLVLRQMPVIICLGRTIMI